MFDNNVIPVKLIASSNVALWDFNLCLIQSLNHYFCLVHFTNCRMIILWSCEKKKKTHFTNIFRYFRMTDLFSLFWGVGVSKVTDVFTKCQLNKAVTLCFTHNLISTTPTHYPKIKIKPPLLSLTLNSSYQNGNPITVADISINRTCRRVCKWLC